MVPEPALVVPARSSLPKLVLSRLGAAGFGVSSIAPAPAVSCEVYPAASLPICEAQSAASLPNSAASLPTPLRRRGVPSRKGDGAARDLSRAERAEGGSGAYEHAERAGPKEVRAVGVDAASGKFDGGLAEQGGLVDRQARAAEGLQKEGRVGGRSEGPDDLAIGASNARKSTTRGEAGGDGVSDVDGAMADGQAAGQEAPMHDEERATRASVLEANLARERRSRGKLQA